VVLCGTVAILGPGEQKKIAPPPDEIRSMSSFKIVIQKGKRLKIKP